MQRPFYEGTELDQNVLQDFQLSWLWKHQSTILPAQASCSQANCSATEEFGVPPRDEASEAEPTAQPSSHGPGVKTVAGL